MNPILIAAGIYLSSRVVSFLANELTEYEREKQKKIDENIEKISSRYEEETESDIEAVASKSEKIVEKKKELCDYLRNEVKDRKEENETLYKEIKDSRNRVREALRADNVVNTPLRKSSLELLLRQLSEAQEKCYSYGQYLDVYNSEIGLKTDSDEPPKFNMQLPNNYPHVGKVIWITSEQLDDRRVEIDVSGLFNVSLTVSDTDALDVAENSLFPIMVTGGNHKSYYASLEKGIFKAYELTNTHLGLSATVKDIQKNYVVLSYMDQLELFLPKDNLIDPYHFPPIRSTLTVYPVNWNFKLEKFPKDGKTIYPVTVSERRKDAGSSLSFKNFPISFTKEEFSAFAVFYKENLQEYEREFLVGPVESEDVILKKGTRLKLQFGDMPLFYIIVDEYEDRSDIFRYYFRFNGMCKPEEKTFSADDIFLPFDVSLAPYYEGTSIETIQHYMEIDDMDDVSALIWDIFEEFRIQDQIRKNREGMGYFFKWESITNQLIAELEQGDSVNIDVTWVEGESYNSVYADVDNPAELESFIKLFAQKTDAVIGREWKPQFFIKDDLGNRYNATVIDAGRTLRIVGRKAYEVFYGNSDFVELFAVNYPYAEYQQKNALRQFRIGQVVNPVIQAACLSSKSIVSNFGTNNEMVPFHNKDLAKNKSQKTSVEQAFKEKNIFFIQGPPGTGKTTVIRELVEQIFATDEESRVLIVSQANVAVDNALSGLIKKYGDETVRCGNGTKITQKFQKLLLQRRCQDYIDDLIQRKENFDETFFKTWQDIVLANESYYYSPVLCELVIRNHRLIGATCVGLAKRNIGLERTEFDLVIIDEAGKALPAELLIPLVRAKKAVIIGDQCQLPPVINPILYDEEKIDLEERVVSENELFRHSFFERLYNNAPDSCKIMLDTQYRMPEVLGTVISKLFYDGKLKNGTGTATREPVLFDSNITFVNYDGDSRYHEKKDGNKQITNLIEAKAAVSLVMSIRKKDPNCEIAVITPYKGQKRLISNSLLNAGIHYQIEKISVDTVDSFQGSEADVVVFCTTRAIQPTLFFKDTRRLNVALSRAKRELIILGRMSYFYRYNRSESCLPSLAEYIQKNGAVISSKQCAEVRTKVIANKAKERLLSMDEISLPTAFYMEEQDNASVDKKMEEFSKHGDFLHPLIVEFTTRGYILKEGFAQFRAAQELSITECLCKVV